MRTEQINAHSITFYNSIKELPEWKWQKLQLIILQQEGIGSTLKDVDSHFERLDTFLRAGKLEDAIEERYNLRFNFNAIINGISVKSMLLACLVENIDGKPVDISTDDGMKQVHDRILQTNIAAGRIDELLDELKKKLLMN